MSLSRIGGLAALICAATYLVGFALLAVYLAPMGYGTTDIDPNAVVAFIHERPGIMLAWNTTIYVVNALALAVLVVALRAHLKDAAQGLGDVTLALGILWAALVLGAGMVANLAVEQAAHMFLTNPVAAAERWHILHAVELGLGGGNEIAGGVWILAVSLAARQSFLLPRATLWLGGVVGASGLATVISPVGDALGAVFGLGAIVWFIAIGWTLTRSALGPKAAYA